jgi:hypothetical protein
VTRKIYADYDEKGIYVYQAFTPSTVAAALAKGTFGKGFNLERMTWIKPSFGWMLYRSGYATKIRQEAILKIKLTHEGFLAILRQSVETVCNSSVYDSADDWRLALKRSDVRHQWDPERYLSGVKHPTQRAIQIGIQGQTVLNYVNEWIIGLEDVTELAHAIHQAKASKRNDFPGAPIERLYTVDDALCRQLGISGA